MRPTESFIGQPIRSLQTMLRVIAEDNPGYVRIIPDGIYGPETMSAVTVFQRRHGIPASGITNQQTWEAIVEEYDASRIRQDRAHPLDIILNPGQVLRKGERHPHVYLVQGMLAALSDVYGSIQKPGLTGLMDEATADALASFQQLSGLPMTGNLDKHTWKHLALQYPLGANLYFSME